MFKYIARKFFTSLFLFIFFSKMAISVATLLILNLNENSVYAVIMQLEIEDQSSGESESKENLLKKEWVHIHYKFDFSHPFMAVQNSGVFTTQHGPVQPFHPTVPTPPPSV